ncbi:MAG TPA: hypothetical protein V6C99_06260, partial [Oculatellaceae cyanobacterium]
MPSVVGDTGKVRKSWLRRLEKLYQRRIKGGQIVSYELAEELCELSLNIGHELTVLMDFQGRVELVALCMASELDQLPGIQVPRRVEGLTRRLMLHTHLNWRPVELVEQVTVLQFHLPLSVILMAGENPAYPGGFSRRFGEHPHFCDGVVLLHPVREKQPDGAFSKLCLVTEPMTARQASEETLEPWIDWAEPVFEMPQRTRDADAERALLMGIHAGGMEAESELEDTLGELRQLAVSAGAVVVGAVSQARKVPDPATYIGSGKAAELALRLQQDDVDLVIADDELTPVQQRNLERILRVKVIDRTEL